MILRGILFFAVLLLSLPAYSGSEADLIARLHIPKQEREVKRRSARIENRAIFAVRVCNEFFFKRDGFGAEGDPFGIDDAFDGTDFIAADIGLAEIIGGVFCGFLHGVTYANQ